MPYNLKTNTKSSHTKKDAFFFSILPALLLMLQLSSYSQVAPVLDKVNSELNFDTSKTAIIVLKKPLYWIFDSTYKSTYLIQRDISVIDSFVNVAVNDFNSWQETNNTANAWNINLSSHNYRKQLVVVINKNSEKEVWVNCFCSSDIDYWKKKLVMFEDGGPCFFNFKINLTQNRYYGFFVNSVG
jgi:hypothetical protein